MRRALLNQPRKFQNRANSINRYFNLQKVCLSTSCRFDAIKPLILSDIGEGTRDVEILKYIVSEGDEIQAWADVVEVQSDKSTVTIQAPKDGKVVKIHWEAGDTVKVGKALVDMEYEGEDDEEEGSQDNSSNEPEEEEVKIMATPAVKQLAEKLGVDLTKITGSGRNNRITKDDVNKAASAGSGSSGQQSNAPSSGKVLATPPVRKFAKENDVDLSLVAGTGPNGRITQEDVQGFLDAASAPCPLAAAPSPSAAAPSAPIAYKPVDISGLAEPVTKKTFNDPESYG